jgi:hypothetical protein
MFHSNSDKNKFGYYSVGTYNTYSRFDAMNVAANANQDIKWHFNKELYSSYNWTDEPSADIKELYRLRALQLREQYDYLVIMSSGGIDSRQIIQSFVDNNIHIDEICTNHELEGAKYTHAFGTGESMFEAAPVAQKIADYRPTKFRNLDSTEIQYNYVKNMTVDTREQSYYNFNVMHSLGSLSKWDVRNYIDDYKKIIDSGKKLVIIYGEGKPFIELNANTKKHQFVFKVSPTTDLMCAPHLQRLNHPGYYDEMFYYGDPNIVIKQSQILLRYLKNFNLYKNLFHYVDSLPDTVTFKLPNIPEFKIFNPVKSDVTTVVDGRKVCMDRDKMHNIIYPGIPIPTWDNGKGAQKVWAPRDEWIRAALSSESKKWYQGYVYHNTDTLPIQQKLQSRILEFSNVYTLEK